MGLCFDKTLNGFTNGFGSGRGVGSLAINLFFKTKRNKGFFSYIKTFCKSNGILKFNNSSLTILFMGWPPSKGAKTKPAVSTIITPVV